MPVSRSEAIKPTKIDQFFDRVDQALVREWTSRDKEIGRYIALSAIGCNSTQAEAIANEYEKHGWTVRLHSDRDGICLIFK